MMKKIVFNGVATSINIVSGLVRNKIFAAFLALNMFGILSIGQQSAAVIFTFFAFGLPLGITTLASGLVASSEVDQRETISRIVSLALMFACMLMVFLAAVMIGDPSYLSRLITNRSDYALPIGILLFSAPLMVIEMCLYAVMEGMGRLRDILIFKIVPALIVLPLMFILASSWLIVGAAIGLVAGELLSSITGFILLRKKIRLNGSALNVSPIFLKVMKVAVLSFLAGVSWLLGDFLVKRFILGRLGEVDNAIVQSVAKVTDLYPNIALAWLSMHLFPELALRRGNAADSVRVIERAALAAMGIIVPIVITFFLFRSVILEVIYKKEFQIASLYFGAMLCTGIPKVYTWVVGVAFLPLGLRKDWFYTTMLFTVIYVAGACIGIANGLSIYFLPVVLFAGYVVQSVYAIVLYRKEGFRFSGSFIVQSVLYLLMAVGTVAAVFWLPAIAMVALMYIAVMYRYGAIKDIVGKMYGFNEKISP